MLIMIGLGAARLLKNTHVENCSQNIDVYQWFEIIFNLFTLIYVCIKLHLISIK